MRFGDWNFIAIFAEKISIMPTDPSIAMQFEEHVREDLQEFLKRKGVLDARVPECPDVEEKWGVIARAYLPDGAREFAGYPVVSLGWMMLIGRAMAFYWDQDWESHGSRDDYYEYLRDRRGYDYLDEVIVGEILGYPEADAQAVSDLAAESASRVLSMLRHAPVEAGTPEAYACYVAALHQLYLAGMAVELNALGYHMEPLN